MALSIGLAQCDITPAPGLPLDGYDARQGTAEGVQDPLFARVLYLGNGATSACIVSLELLGVSNEFAERLRRGIAAATEVDADDVIVAASHTHSGPCGFATSQPRSPEASRHVDSVARHLLDAAAEARRAARPCSLAFAQRPTIGIAANRIDPDGPVDPHVRVIRILDATTAALRGMIVHFACHPTVLGEDNLTYSGDFVGRALRQLERTYRVPCLFLQGAAADISTRFTRSARTSAEADRLSHALVAAVRGTFGDPSRALSAALASAHARAQLPRRAAPGKDALEALVRATSEDAERVARATDDPSTRSEGLLRHLQTKLDAAEHLLRAHAPGQASRQASSAPITTTLTGLRLGDIVLVSVPGELFHGTARTIAGHGEAWLPVTLSNDYLGYFPTREAVANAEYEALTSAFDDAATAALASAIAHLVATLRHDPAATGTELP